MAEMKMYEYGKGLLLKELSEFAVDLPSKSNEDMIYNQGRVAGAIFLCDSADDEKLFHHYHDLIHSEMVRRATDGRWRITEQ